MESQLVMHSGACSVRMPLPGRMLAASAVTVPETLWVATWLLRAKSGQTARLPVLEHSTTDTFAASCNAASKSGCKGEGHIP